MGNYFINNFSKTAKKIDFITYFLSEKPCNVGNVIEGCRKKMKNNKNSHCRKKKNLLNCLVLLKKEENLNDLLRPKIRRNNKVESLNNDLLCNPLSTPLYYGSKNNNDVIDNDINKKIIKRFCLVNIDDQNKFNCRCCILLSSAKFYGKVKVGTLFIQKTHLIIRYFEFKKLTYQYTIYPLTELLALKTKYKNKKILTFKNYSFEMIFGEQNIGSVKFYILTNFNFVMETFKRIPLLREKLNH
uniref:GRAM domain-containing protein n=1 Tax=Strongyloides papillosus TaxID=174720 RepID=A0A0N5B3S1_STREA